MPENKDRDENSSDSIMADNHEWADRLASGRQKHLERIGLIVIIAIAAAVIVLSLW